jgi:hypothetical protein
MLTPPPPTLTGAPGITTTAAEQQLGVPKGGLEERLSRVESLLERVAQKILETAG